MGPQPVIRNRMVKIAGIWMVVSGTISIFATLTAAFILWTFSDGLAWGYRMPGNAPLSIILALGLIFAIPAVVTLLGGLNTFSGRRWELGLAGSICGILYLNILAVPPLVMLIIARPDFSRGIPE